MKILPRQCYVCRGACKVEFKLTILFTAIKNNCLFWYEGFGESFSAMHLDLKISLFCFLQNRDYVVCHIHLSEHIKGGFVRFMFCQTICLLDRWVVERVICFRVMMILCAHIGTLYHENIILNFQKAIIFRRTHIRSCIPIYIIFLSHFCRYDQIFNKINSLRAVG